MKIRHYSTFNNTNNELVWEQLRNDETEKHYFIPFTKDEYLRKVDTKNISDTARIVINEVKKVGVKKIFSIGSGIAAVEYQIQKNSAIAVTVSDYNKSVLRLKEFELFEDAIMFDAFSDALPLTKDYVMLFPRIDTEFNNIQLEALFKRCSEAEVKYLIFIPANIITYKGLLAELKIFVYCLVKKRPRVFCGYMRSRNEFRKLWTKYYKLTKAYKDGQELYMLETLCNKSCS